MKIYSVVTVRASKNEASDALTVEVTRSVVNWTIQRWYTLLITGWRKDL